MWHLFCALNIKSIFFCFYTSVLKWLRAVPKGAYTGAHVDRVYMGRGTENLYTTWIPFGDNPPEMGSLCMLHKSNQLSKERKKVATTSYQILIQY